MGIKTIFINQKEIEKLNKRDCFKDIVSFIDKSNGSSGRVVALYGLRRTGKTILMSQLAINYNIPYIYQVDKDTTMDEVMAKLDEELERGAKVVFLDEVTNSKDFVTNSALLADCYAKVGLDVVIAGTDSLEIAMAEEQELLDRMYLVYTTYISYAEYCRVLNILNIDEYIQYGGLMRKGLLDSEAVTDIVSAKRYLDSAVADNIVNSLQKNPDYPGFNEIKKYSRDDIRLMIQRLVELYNGSFTINDLNNIISKDPEIIFRYKKLDNKTLREEYKKSININKELTDRATEQLVDELEKTFKMLEILAPITVREFSKEGEDWTKRRHTEYYLVQPAIKYYHLKEAQKILLDSDALESLTDNERESLAGQLQNYIFGLMTEVIVQNDVSKLLNDKCFGVYKPKFKEMERSVGEYDLLIYDKKANAYYCFEIKHTSTPYLAIDNDGKYIGQDKNLLNEDFMEEMNHQFGTRICACVLYNGDSFKAPTGTIYLNVSNFLVAIDKYRDIQLAMTELAKNLPVRTDIMIEGPQNYVEEFLLHRIELAEENINSAKIQVPNAQYEPTYTKQDGFDQTDD